MELVKNKGLFMGIGMGIGLIGWEYGANINRSDIKPSILLNRLGYHLENIFSHIGSGLAKINNNLTKWQAIPATPLFDFSRSLYKIITSPKYLLTAYFGDINIRSINITIAFLICILLTINYKSYFCPFYDQFRRIVIPIIY